MEKHFEPYGKLVSVRIRRNFAFVQYESQDDATKALDATNMRYNLHFKTYLIFTESPLDTFQAGEWRVKMWWGCSRV